MSAPSRELLHQLYGAPPDRFVPVRDAAVAEARQAGDPATAREIGKLRRPTVAAWLVNLLAIRRPELVADLAQLAEALREAQRDLRGPKLRELSAKRRAVVAALVTEARNLAGEVEGAPPAGRLPLAEVEATLNAALSDTEVAAQVRSGRLLRAASYAGFGEVPRPQLRLLTGGADEPAEEQPGPEDRTTREGGTQSSREADRARRAERDERVRRRRVLERELAKARTDQQRAEAELTGATEAERDAADELAAIEAELAEIERRRAAAEQEISRRKLARRGAERAVAVARRHTGEVEGALEALTEEEERAPGTAADTAH